MCELINKVLCGVCYCRGPAGFGWKADVPRGTHLLLLRNIQVANLLLTLNITDGCEVLSLFTINCTEFLGWYQGKNITVN